MRIDITGNNVLYKYLLFVYNQKKVNTIFRLFTICLLSYLNVINDIIRSLWLFIKYFIVSIY